MPKVLAEQPGLAQMIHLAAVLILALLLLYLGIVLIKGRAPGVRGDHMRMVDSIAITPTARLALVAIDDGDVYLLSVSNDRITLIDKVGPGPAVDRIRGRPASSEPARTTPAQTTSSQG